MRSALHGECKLRSAARVVVTRRRRIIGFSCVDRSGALHHSWFVSFVALRSEQVPNTTHRMAVNDLGFDSFFCNQHAWLMQDANYGDFRLACLCTLGLPARVILPLIVWVLFVGMVQASS